MRLSEPIPTNNPNAWLGEGIYFWYHEQDAIWWGRMYKRSTGGYEVYTALIDCENVLDTVFNEEHYLLWIDEVEKAIVKLLENDRRKLSLNELNCFFKKKGAFREVDGIMFQDISNNSEYWIADKFQYKKRIQLAVYNRKIINNFGFKFEA